MAEPISFKEKEIDVIGFQEVGKALDSVWQFQRVDTARQSRKRVGGKRVSAEERLASLRDCVRLLVLQFSSGDEYIDVISVYDTGLATGFYKKSAAITQGFRRNTAQRYVELRKGKRPEYLAALRQMYSVGYQQGCLLSAGLWD